jgi:hypothetical protein
VGADGLGRVNPPFQPLPRVSGPRHTDHHHDRQAQSLALSLPINTDAQRVAQNQLVLSIDRALEARRVRLALSDSAIDHLRLTALFLSR